MILYTLGSDDIPGSFSPTFLPIAVSSTPKISVRLSAIPFKAAWMSLPKCQGA